MIRTIINLDSDEKTWLERTAKSAGVPMTELVREAPQTEMKRCSAQASLLSASASRSFSIDGHPALLPLSV